MVMSVNTKGAFIVSNANEIIKCNSDDWWPLDPDWYKHHDPDWFNKDFEVDPCEKDKDDSEEENHDEFDEPIERRGPYDGDWGP